MKQNDGRAILYMIGVSAIFSVQDGFSRHLAEAYNVNLVLMLRYWFLGIFVMALAQRRQGGIAKVARTRQPLLQLVRGLLLITETTMVVWAFTRIGLAESHAIFASYPLIAVAFSVPILREHVGWRRWLAICAGFAGVLVILRPGLAVFSAASLIALLASSMFALYTVLTRLASRKDSAQTNYFYTGVVGAILTTFFGLWNWEVMTLPDYGWMLVLCVLGSVGHLLLIHALELADSSTVQPFAYLQLVFASAIGVVIFHEHIDFYTVLGAAMIVAAGLFAIWREKRSQNRIRAMSEVSRTGED